MTAKKEKEIRYLPNNIQERLFFKLSDFDKSPHYTLHRLLYVYHIRGYILDNKKNI